MNPKELIEILENKLEQSPTNQEVKEQLAFLLLSQGNVSRAEALFSEIIKLNPVAPNALWGLAKVNWQKKSYEAAYSYMTILSSMPDNKLTKEQALVFAKILAKRSQFKEASQWLDAAIAQDSSLLQAEMSLLKFIKQHLSPPHTELPRKGQDGLEIPIPLPMFGNIGNIKSTQYIVVEISHIESNLKNTNSLSQSDSTESSDESEKEDLSQLKKIITFDQVGGLRKAKQALIQQLILPLKNPQLCSLYGKSVNPKILLYGPSGCGKTLLSRALSTESEITFLPLRPIDFLDLSYEECELRLVQILQHARENKPAVIFIDEISWLAHKQSPERADSESYFYRMNLLNNLLEVLNGQFPMNNQVGVLATTNVPWSLDHAFLTSNKINKHIFIGSTLKEDRAEILRLSLESRVSPVLVPDKIDCVKVIDSLKHISSGADIEELIDLALSDLLVETVVQIQNGSVQQDKKPILTNERLIKTGKKLKRVSAVELWLKEAKLTLKPKDSPLHHMWEQVEESEITSSSSRMCKNIIRNKI